MTLLLVFAVTLVIAVLVSDIAENSILSTAILFLIAGFLTGRGWLGPAAHLHGDLLQRMSEIALFSILFTDGIRTGGLRCIIESWHLPGRALLIGMPLTIVGIALLARYLLSAPWIESFLVASVLSPTDPVFVSAIFRFEKIPYSVKSLLNVESGLNDGLALPIVILLLARISPNGASVRTATLELLLGILIGIGVPWLSIHLEQTRFFQAAGLYEALNAFSIGLLVMAICYSTGANLFLGAYSAGITIASLGGSAAKSFGKFGELIAELLKLSALLIFGAVIAPNFFAAISGADYAFIFLAVFVVRTPAIIVSLLGTELPFREKLLAGWFGPKGFASVVYGILILQVGLAHLAHLVGLAVAASIFVYSSTDILIGRWFEAHEERASQESDELINPAD